MNKYWLVVSVSAIGILFALSALAENMNLEMGTTFTCTNNAECKRKCEALGGRWKPNTGGATHGDCYLRRNSLSELLVVSRDTLRDEKKVALWVPVDEPGSRQVTDTNDDDDDIDNVVYLTPSECDALGGDVDFHAGCSGTLLKCTTKDSNGKRHSICIDEIDKVIERPIS